MNLARQINNKLDEIIIHNQTLAELEKDYENTDFDLVEEDTGEKVTKEIVLNKAQKIKEQIIEDLNKITRNGQNIRDTFTNDYYVNDIMQDKEIAEQDRANKLFKELDKQKAEEN